ncbi:molecular chaperone [Pusillimonas sp. ANT_WB101]|uniref:fimbrial biogenesis chaperone n=1 Tax=Pusillimonas sp. ANT_WB101 TaxID=2597356 RepID=UPI0011EFE639|nr:fimbria/pilus periplasmic chaperone [Pusillimonas sp. ANT_WB101]KAA0891097.1 molecular chaperone [Pusillimonas sp. ANT_WB101]
MNISSHIQASAVALVLAFAIPGAASAAHLQAAPIMLELQASQNAEALWLTNPGDTPLQAQIRVYRWTQVSGEDDLAHTTELLATPAMISVPAGERQMIRMIRTQNSPTAGDSELAYRVVVDEIPTDAQAAGVQFAVRYSIPVFVHTQKQSDTASPMLVWNVMQKDAKIFLQANNTGHTRAQIIDVKFTPANGKPIVLTPGLYGYALAGSTRIWQLEEHGKVMLAGGTIDAKINQQPQQFVIPAAKKSP